MRKQSYKKIFFLLVLFFLVNVSIGYSAFTNLTPASCQDSDGDCNVTNLVTNDNVFEAVDLLTSPYGWINATGFSLSIPNQNTIDNATIHVLWKSDVHFGANNINVDYWNSTQWVNCAGPFSENSSVSDTTCNVSSLSKNQINSIKVRFRGQDTNGFPNAFGYVDNIRIDLNHSAPPIWDNQTTNSTRNMVFIGNSIMLSAQLFDDLGLNYAWLSTNESGNWMNYTPTYLNNLGNTWIWVNFSWKNDSIRSGVIGWKIYVNDTTGKQNVTNTNTFFVQFRMLPSSCQDSDGDCNVTNLVTNDNVFEAVDLLTSPYGWINVSRWSINLSSDSAVRSAFIHVLWKSDVHFGANNINVDYWNSTQWVNCAGPFSENSSVSDTTCNVSSLSKNQINSIKVRFRGQDTNGFPNAFGYVDNVYVEVNYTSGIPYLEVYLNYPNSSATTNIIQNSTFLINSTVYCRGNSCGNVMGTVMYNLTSANPDTPINTTKGDKPFYIQETPANSLKSCSNNPLGIDDYCNIIWTVNASGNVNTNWKVGVVFNSTSSDVRVNSTTNATVSIVSCTVDFSLNWNSIKFGLLNPSTGPNSAPGNSENQYNITVNSGSCDVDFYINGNDLVNTTLNSKIGIGNLTWSNSSNTYSESFNMSSNLTALKLNITQGVNFTTWYWINVPPVYSGYYNGNIYIFGVQNGRNPT